MTVLLCLLMCPRCYGYKKSSFRGMFILLLIFYAYNVLCVPIKPSSVNVIENETEKLQPAPQMDAIVYKTINKYFCSIEDMSGINLILYGTNTWTFPEQDVNLTLRYPTHNKDVSNEEANYIVTGFQVVLYMDGLGSNGFITSGGILRDNIELTFTSRQISMLRYQFWVYGIWGGGKQLNEINPSRMCY